MPKVTKQTTAKPVLKTHKVGTAVDRISSIGFSESDGIKLTLYGQSGTGKTRICSTFPKPILFMICSGGKQPGELRSIDTPANRKTISQLPVAGSSDISEIIAHQLSEAKYATVVLDHATGLQDIVLSEILGIEQIPAQKSWGLASRDQWGQCALQMKTMLRELLSLTCNVVVVAQEREFEVGEENSLLMPHVGAALTKSTVGWLNPASDYIGQTYIRQRTTQEKVKIGGKIEVATKTVLGKVDYCLRTAPDPIFITKFRLPRGSNELPECIVDPSYEKIIKLIRGG